LRKMYICEKCGKNFCGEDECTNYEKACAKEYTFTCFKCGKIIKWNSDDIDSSIIENQCHIIDLGRGGYGSKLDGCDISFGLCDVCLSTFVESFKLRENIYNSGSNVNYNFYLEEDQLNEEENKDWEDDMIDHDN